MMWLDDCGRSDVATYVPAPWILATAGHRTGTGQAGQPTPVYLPMQQAAPTSYPETMTTTAIPAAKLQL